MQHFGPNMCKLPGTPGMQVTMPYNVGQQPGLESVIYHAQQATLAAQTAMQHSEALKTIVSNFVETAGTAVRIQARAGAAMNTAAAATTVDPPGASVAGTPRLEKHVPGTPPLLHVGPPCSTFTNSTRGRGVHRGKDGFRDDSASGSSNPRGGRGGRGRGANAHCSEAREGRGTKRDAVGCIVERPAMRGSWNQPTEPASW